MINIIRLLTSFLILIISLLVVPVVSAGTIFTSEVNFNAAIAGYDSYFTEDFESFSLGIVPDPLAIGGGLAEVVDGGNAMIWDNTPGGDNAWLQAAGTQANAM